LVVIGGASLIDLTDSIDNLPHIARGIFNFFREH